MCAVKKWRNFPRYSLFSRMGDEMAQSGTDWWSWSRLLSTVYSLMHSYLVGYPGNRLSKRHDEFLEQYYGH